MVTEKSIISAETLTEKQLDLWGDLLSFSILEESHAVIMGIFLLEGTILYANAGMKTLLDLGRKGPNPLTYLVNTTFNDLCSRPAAIDPIFSGILTVNDHEGLSVSITARVYHRDGEIMVIGEHNVAELTQYNRQTIALNREITNLQRELIREKKHLEATLTKLRETQAMLVQSEKMNALGQLTAGVAHEINNPIGYVLANLYNLDSAFRDVTEAYRELEEVAMDCNRKETAEAIARRHDLAFVFSDYDSLYTATREGVLRVKKIVEHRRIDKHTCPGRFEG